MERLLAVLSPERIMAVGKILLIIIFILIATGIVARLADVLIDRFFRARVDEKRYIKLDPKRHQTLITILKSLVRYTIYFVGGMAVLEKLGIPTGSLLATAGIGGLAVGFGAQNLVRDVITGFFLLLEGQYSVGDYIQVAGVSGIVEEMGIRVTKIRDFGGQLHIVPNGRIEQVTNYMGSAMRVMFDVGVAYEEDIEEVIAVLEELFAELKEQIPALVEGPVVLGVNELSDSAVVIRVLARTVPMEQWATERQIRKAIKQRFDERGIEIPYPRRFIIFPQNRDNESANKRKDPGSLQETEATQEIDTTAEANIDST